MNLSVVLQQPDGDGFLPAHEVEYSVCRYRSETVCREYLSEPRPKVVAATTFTSVRLDRRLGSSETLFVETADDGEYSMRLDSVLDAAGTSPPAACEDEYWRSPSPDTLERGGTSLDQSINDRLVISEL